MLVLFIGVIISRFYRQVSQGQVLIVNTMGKEPKVAFTYFGDGATSSSEFHNGANFAGVFKTPTIFLCRNNGWAISVPVERQTASATFALTASSFASRSSPRSASAPLIASVTSCVLRVRRSRPCSKTRHSSAWSRCAACVPVSISP